MDEAAKLGKATQDAYNLGGWLILQAFLKIGLPKVSLPTLMYILASWWALYVHFLFFTVYGSKLGQFVTHSQKNTRLINDKRYTSSNYIYTYEVTHTVNIMAIFSASSKSQVCTIDKKKISRAIVMSFSILTNDEKWAHTENKTKKKKIDMLFDAYVLFHVHVLQWMLRIGVNWAFLVRVTHKQWNITVWTAKTVQEVLD